MNTQKERNQARALELLTDMGFHIVLGAEIRAGRMRGVRLVWFDGRHMRVDCVNQATARNVVTVLQANGYDACIAYPEHVALWRNFEQAAGVTTEKTAG